jgi:hypothetical protein
MSDGKTKGRWLNDWTWQDAHGIQHVGSTIPKHALKSKPCNAIALHDPDYVCVKSKGHKGEHESERHRGGTVASWTTEADGSEAGKRSPVSLTGRVGASSGGWSIPSRSAAKKLNKRKAASERSTDEEAATYEGEFNAAGISAHEDELLLAIERKTKRLAGETHYQHKTRILRGYIAQRAKLNGKPKKAASDSPLALSADRTCGVGLPGTGRCQMHAGHGGEHLLIDGTRVFTWTE